MTIHSGANSRQDLRFLALNLEQQYPSSRISSKHLHSTAKAIFTLVEILETLALKGRNERNSKSPITLYLHGPFEKNQRH